jgi:elongation factor 1-alpha
MGDNLIKKSEKMPWWSGNEVKTLDDRTVKVETLLNALNDMAVVPERKVRAGCGLGRSAAVRLWG